jgi:pimeloyl-ACP methyl ester carboxylesterase
MMTASSSSLLPTIVFTHGFLDSPDCWNPLVEALPVPIERLIAIHLRAASDPKARGDTLASYADQVAERVKREVGSDRVLLVGHSMGGAITELAALCLADRLAAMVLITPSPLAGFSVSDEQLAVYRSRLDDPTEDSVRQAKRDRSLNLGPGALSLLVSANLDTHPAFARQQLDAWTGGHPAGENASGVQVPVLLVTSDDALFTHFFLVSKVGSRFDHLDVRRVRDAGHWPQLEQSAETARIIAEFASHIA